MLGAILLAAGNSSRFGENKLLYELDGRPMYSYVLEHFRSLLREQRIDILIVVTQYDCVQSQIEAAEGEVSVVRNEHPELGISHSIYLGLQKLAEVLPEAEGCVFAVADQPYLTVESLEGLVDTWEESDRGIAACACGDKIGNPVLFSRKYFEQLGGLTGDKGGKQIVKRNLEDVVLHQIPARELEDIDVKAVLEK